MIAMKTVAANRVEKVELPIPAPGEGEVVIRMLATGICAGDMQIFHGKHKYVQFPVIQGHEGTGVVHEAGDGVAGFRQGQRVNVQQQLACGECYACKKGRHNVCVNMKGLIGVQADGMFSQYFRCPAWNVAPVPADFSVDKGMLAEPASVGVNAARTARIRPGERVVVIGAGIIGNFTAQACRAMGAADVLVADIADAKLKAAELNGIRHGVNSKDRDLRQAIAEAFDGEQADVIFDCAGVEASIKQVIEVAANSSRVVIVANFKEPVTFDIPTFQRREIAILSVMGTTKETTFEAIDLLHNDTITINGLISRRFPLERMMDAYRYIEANPATVMKVAIDIGEP